MRIGLIGYGAWGELHAQAIEAASGAELQMICCRSSRSAERASAAHPRAVVCRDWHEVVSAELDAVDIVVPNALHAEIGVAALAAGKDVLIEKPLATTVEDCERLIAAAATNQRVLSVGHELRLSAQWGAIKQILDQGDLGEPRYASFSLFRFPFRQGADGWRYDPAQIGSWLLEEPVHFFDLMLWYFGSWGDPLSIRALANGPLEHHGMQENVSVWLRFPNSLYATITQTLGGFENHTVLEIVGTEGSLRTWWSGVMDRTLAPRFELKVQYKGGDAPVVVPIEKSGEVFELKEQLQRTIDAFADRRPIVSGADGRRAVVLCLAAERSIAEEREIELQL